MPSDPDALSVRDYLHWAASRKGICGEDLVAEVVQWGVLKDDLIATGRSDNPTVEEYAEHFRRASEEAQADFDEFVDAVGVEPLVFWEIEEEALANGPRPVATGDLLEDVYVVAV
jgi:hypothetical protein